MGWIAGVVVAVIILFIIFTVLSGIRIVRPTHRGLVERLGKYNRYADPGIHLTIPYGIERMYQVDIREVLVEAQPQTIITNDNLNAKVDAQVYLKVKADEENVKASIYNVTNYELQIVNLSRTTLRNIIGTMTLKSANRERGKINEELRGTLKSETASWGIEILRTELKEIDPPPDVQETMNKVVKAENEKIAAIDFATATETQADGARRAEIKKAEGIRQAKILEAEGEAQAIQLVNEAADKYFVGNAQMLRKLEAVERALYQNSKVVVPGDTQLVNVIGDLGGLAADAHRRRQGRTVDCRRRTRLRNRSTSSAGGLRALMSPRVSSARASYDARVRPNGQARHAQARRSWPEIGARAVHVALAGGRVEEQIAGHAGLPGDIVSGVGRAGIEAGAAAATAAFGDRDADGQSEIGEHGGQAQLGAGLGETNSAGLADPAEPGLGRGRLVGEDPGRPASHPMGGGRRWWRRRADDLAAALEQGVDELAAGRVEQGVDAAILAP